MTSSPASDHVDLAVLGTVVRVCLDEPADRPAVEDPWHLCVLPPGGPEIPSSRVVRLPATEDDRSRGWALTSLTQEVTRAAITEQTGRLVMFHAGALSSLETGATVAYVAPGGTGKTTITTTLGPGRGYLTDETVAVTPSGAVKPYPKPLSVRQAGMGKDEVPPRSLGLQPAGAEPWLAALLVVRRDPEHVGGPRVSRPGLLDGIVALSPEISSLAALSTPLLTLRGLVERVGGVLQVTYREAHQLEEILAEGLGRART